MVEVGQRAPLRRRRRRGSLVSDQVRTGVVGVGNMGRHHARVYSELPGVDLLGVADVDADRAAEVAAEFDTAARDRETLLARTDAVSVVVPTRFHEAVARAAIDAGTDMLVEKPFVADPEVGRDLLAAAREADCLVQVGHIERYNPAVRALGDVMVDADPIAFAARRQGPPVDRDSVDSVVFDLMIHDIDVICSLTDEPVTDVAAFGAAAGGHVVAQLEFADGRVASLTASRVTQERVRDLAVTAEDCHVEVDYMDQSVEIHRHSLPEYVATDGDVRYRHESVIERPTVETGEPLKNELSSFAESVRERTEPETTGEDGIRAVELAERIEAATERDADLAPTEVPSP
ncbi:oxidoreductase domain protein [Halosimplex carlsbadense 2-9-1]|uniref:Oxidoreductase domain protein n=1 Tax=Halosimplex carlsbadense 2-9-1 TaxID=797114 RepID=M0CGD5_9EURY|nr:oxidoreductase domain protein [Halosimplex carlsbadense 2-9-1]